MSRDCVAKIQLASKRLISLTSHDISLPILFAAFINIKLIQSQLRLLDFSGFNLFLRRHGLNELKIIEVSFFSMLRKHKKRRISW